jgi:hypothetical protein
LYCSKPPFEKEGEKRRNRELKTKYFVKINQTEKEERLKIS